MAWPKGRPLSEETKDKISRALIGVPLSPTHRLHISQGMRKRKMSPFEAQGPGGPSHPGRPGGPQRFDSGRGSGR